MRGRREWLVMAAGLLAVGLSALPAMAQTADPTSTTVPPDSSTTTTETGITLLPSTTSTDLVTTTSVRRTTTTVRRTTTTTSELLEPNATVELPTTTSLPPERKFDKGVSAGSLVLLVITALVLIALVLSLFTYKFWRSTRPVPPALGSTVPKHG